MPADPAHTAKPDLECDLLVVGSGASGLACAMTAARLGLKVTVVEKERVLGGTSAWSGGWMWIPRNPLARAAGRLAKPYREAPAIAGSPDLRFGQIGHQVSVDEAVIVLAN